MAFLPIDGVPGFAVDQDTGDLLDQSSTPSSPAPAQPPAQAPAVAAPQSAPPAPPAAPAPAAPRIDPLQVQLRALEQNERAGGVDKHHPKIMSGPLKGETAGGAYALTPSTARSYLAQYPELVRAFPELAGVKSDNDRLSTWLNQHPEADDAIARVAWSDHLRKTNGNPHQAAILWFGGPDSLDFWKRAAANPSSLSKEDRARFDELDKYGHRFDVNLERSKSGTLQPISRAPGPVVGDAGSAFAPVPPSTPVQPTPPPHATPAGFQPVGADASAAGAGEDPNVDPNNPPPDWKPGRTFFGSMGVGPALKSATAAIAGGNTPEANNAPPPGPVSPLSDLGPGGNMQQQGPTPSGATLEDSLRASEGTPAPTTDRSQIGSDKQIKADTSSTAAGAPAAPTDPSADLEARIADVDRQVLGQVNDLSGWTDEQKTRLNGFLDSIKDGKVDPNHFWSSMSTGHRILAAISLGLGAFGAALSHGRNEAAEMISSAIQQDLASQVHNLGRQTTLYSEALKQFGDERQARLATILGLNSVARSMVQELRAMKGGKMAAGTVTSIAGLNAGVKAIDDRLDQLSQAFHGPIGALVGAIPIATKTHLAKETKGATDMAIADAMRTGRFSSELIDQISKMTPNVDNSPQMQAAMLGAIRQHLIEKIAELQSGGASSGPTDAESQQEEPSGYEDVGDEGR